MIGEITVTGPYRLRKFPLSSVGFINGLLLFCPSMDEAKISLEQVRHVADLARLKLDDHELETMRRQLNSILDYMDSLNELDVSDVEPFFYSVEMESPLRPDRVKPSLHHEEALQAAPDRADGGFAVPKVLNGDS